MTKILNHINTYADLTAYNNDMGKDFPNISYIVMRLNGTNMTQTILSVSIM